MRIAARWAVVGVWVLLSQLSLSGQAQAGDEVIDRSLRLRPAPRPATGSSAWLDPVGEPSSFQMQPFPSILRDPSLPQEPDGLLWRRLRERFPDRAPVDLLTQSPAALRTYLAQAAARAADPDTIRVLAIRVDFAQDSAGDQSSTLDGRFDLRPADSARVAVDPPPHDKAFFDSHLEAIARYYYKQSGGSLVLEWDIYPAENDSAYSLSDTADYGPWWMSGFDIDILALADRFVRDSYRLADSAADPPDFRRYDSFLLFHSGADFQGDIKRDSPYDIPSFNIFLADPVAVQDSTFFIDLILVVPETVSQDGYLGALNGVMVHEFGHQLGFYDLYNVFNFYPQVGMFSLMDSGEQMYGRVWDPYREQEVFVRGAIPASVDPWHKLVFFPDGLNARWITEATTIDLPAVQVANEMALVPIGGQGIAESPGSAHLSGSEYFIVESRPYDINGDGLVYLEADSLTGVILGPRNIPLDVTDSMGVAPDTLGQYETDYLLPGEGLLIWHIDNAAIRDAFRVCYGCVNIFGERRGVDVEEADGIEDLGNIYSVEWVGGRLDYWHPDGYTRFGPDTDPNSATSAGAVTDISIEVLAARGDTLQVAFQRGRIAPGWPRYAGRPFGIGGMASADLDGDGIDEILTTGGGYLQRFSADGSGGLLAVADSSFLPGIAIRAGFVNDHGQIGSVLAAATNTQVLAFEGGAPHARIMRYPDSDHPFPDLRFTTAPLALDSVLVVGDNQGRLRGLMPGSADPLVWRTAEPGFAVSALAGGALRADGPTVLVWGNQVGEVYVADGGQSAGFGPRDGWPRRVGNRAEPVRSILLLQGSAPGEGLILALNGAGELACWDESGNLGDGWPRYLGDAPAGYLAVGDPDDDGLLEVAATTRGGQIHLFQLDGNQEIGWPRSVWHPDARVLGAVRSGPMFADLNGDGRIEIVQGSADGSLHAWSAAGKGIDGYPVVVGYGIRSGPILAPLGADGAPALLAADEEGFVTVIRTGLGPRSAGPGEMWSATGDASRSFLYPRALIPAPQGYAALLDRDALVFTPNPVEGGEGALRLRMGRPGTLQIRLFDTAGHKVWDRRFDDVAVGQGGDVLALDLSAVSPGLYVAKITARGDGDEVSVLRKLAIIR